MKKTLKTFVAFSVALVCTLCLVACGKTVKLTEKNVVGTYDVSQSIYTDYGKEAKTYTKERYTELKNKGENRTDPENEEYEDLEDLFGMTYTMKDDKTIVEKQGETETTVGTWAITDGKLVVTKDENYMKGQEVLGTITITSEWDTANGNVVITIVFAGKTGLEEYSFTNVMTLVKQA